MNRPPNNEESRRSSFWLGIVLIGAFVFLLLVSAIGGRVAYEVWLVLLVIGFGAAAVASRRSG